MRRIFFITSCIFLLLQNSIIFAAPNSNADAKIDVESLGLDSVDQNQNIKNTEKKPETLPVTKNQPDPDTASVIEKNSANVNIDGSVNQKDNSKILSKIQSFIKGKDDNKNNDKNTQTASQNPITATIDNAVKTTTATLQKLKKAKLRERIAKEKKKAEEKRIATKKKAKEERLNKLREEYLIQLISDKKDEDLSDEDFDKKEDDKIIPIEKTLNWSDRFVSYEPQPAPISSQYRDSENKHIPIISTTQQRIDDMFQTIVISRDPEDFNAHYKYVLDPNIRNANGETILTLATLLQRYGVMSSILAKGADPDLPNALGHTALDIAIAMLDLRSAQILIDMNADITYTNGLGRNYLMEASQVGFLPIVDLLVSQHIIDIDALDNENNTALEIAQKYKQEIVVKFLLKAGASTSVKKPYKILQQNLIKELETRWGPKPDATEVK